MLASEHFTYAELTRSQAATRASLPNQPSRLARTALETLCNYILEPVRANFGPVHVSSGYRSPAVNALIGGSSSSQHMKGEAADIECAIVSNLVLAKWIRDTLDFDQLILEFYNENDPRAGWVHVSYRAKGNRNESLVARSVNGKTAYSKGLPIA